MDFLSENRRNVIASSIGGVSSATFIFSKVLPQENAVEIWGMDRAKHKWLFTTLRLPNLENKYGICRQLILESINDAIMKCRSLTGSTFRERENWAKRGRIPDGCRFYVLSGEKGVLTYPDCKEARTFTDRRTAENLRDFISRDKTGFYPENNYRVILVRDIRQDNMSVDVWDYNTHFTQTASGWYMEKPVSSGEPASRP